jgi:hypothetical protein
VAAASPSAASAPASLAALAGWAHRVADVCTAGAKLYPTVALGMNGDVDTVAYGIQRLHASVSAVPPDSTVVDVKALDVALRHGAAAAAELEVLAQAPSTTRGERAEAMAEAEAFLAGLVALGVEECRALLSAD